MIGIALLIIVSIATTIYARKRYSISIQSILSTWAIALSTIACIITWLRVEIYTTNDTFVGIMAGLMGACATLVVGVQIYNTIDTKNTINELNKSFEEKIKALDQSIDIQIRDSKVLQNELNYELNNTKKELERAKKEREISELIIDAGIARCYGMSLHQVQPFTAFESFTTALKTALIVNEPSLIRECLNSLEVQSQIIQKYSSGIDFFAMEIVAKFDFNSLNKYPSYSLIEKECNSVQKVIRDRISTIKKTSNQVQP